MQEYEPKKGAIFDLDGTLLDTIEDLFDSINYTLHYFHEPIRTLAEIKSFVGSGIKMLLKRSLSKEIDAITFEKYLSFFQNHYAENLKNKTVPYPGIMKILNELKDMNVIMGIVSNKFQEGTDALKKHFFSGLIDVAIGNQKEIMPKPAPDSLYLAIHKLGLDANQDKILYIGDSDIDILTAKNAGIPVLAVTWGFRLESELSALNPDYIAKDPEDIIRAVKEL